MQSQPSAWDLLVAGIKPYPVIIGAVIDLALTIVLLMLVSPLFIPADVWQLDDASFRQATESVVNSPAYLLATLLLGYSATVVGAYVAAWRANIVHLKHGVWVAVTSTLLGFVLTLGSNNPSPPFWYELLAWLLIIPSGLLGGYLAREARRKQSLEN